MRSRAELRSWVDFVARGAVLTGLLGLSACSSRLEALRSLDQLTGRAQAIHAEASAAEAELGAAEPIVAGTAAEAPVRSAKERQARIQHEARAAQDELGQVTNTVRDDLQDVPRWPWYVRFILLPIGGLLGLALLVSVLGSMGVPLLTQAAAWMARKGFGFGGKLADVIGRAVQGREEQVPNDVALDRIATAARSSALGNAVWKQTEKDRVVKKATRMRGIARE